MTGIRFTVAVGALLLSWGVGGDTAQARLARITTEAGAQFEGQVVAESEQTITLRIAGIDTPVPREGIREVVFRPSPVEVYHQQRATLTDEDRDGRLGLIRELFDQGELDLADLELRPLHADFPDDDGVALLATIVTERLRLRDAVETRSTAASAQTPRRPAREVSGRSGRNPAATAPAVTAAVVREPQVVDPQKLLSDAQIHQLRLWELPENLREMRSSIVMPREAVDQFLVRYASNTGMPRGRRAQDDFRRLEAWQQLQKFFQMRARDLYAQVQVRNDPPRLQDYRQGIYPSYILTYFHRHFGSGQVPELVLFGSEAGMQGALTNFYILSTLRIDGLPLLDRRDPARSLLLQWGLPREAAFTPAPQVPGWRAFFRSMDDPRFQSFVQWIDSLYNDPEYGLDYTLPTAEDLRPARTERREATGNGTG